MKDVDARLIKDMGFPETVLIENAGRAVAEEACAFLGGAARKRIVLLCGKGNNGGDGLAALRFLSRFGASCSLILTAEPEQMGKAAQAELVMTEGFAFPRFVWEKEPQKALASARQADLLLDGLVGTSFHGSLREPILSFVRALKELTVPILAIDLPSGVDADTGKAALALKADLTVTMVAPKPGLYLYPGALYAGAVKVHTIGTPKQVEEEAKSTMTLLDDAFVAPLLPHRPKNAHKGTNGRIALVAGSRGYIGAAELVSKAAVRAGGGLVTVYTEQAAWEPLAIKSTEVMVKTFDPLDVEASVQELLSSDVVAIGPGLGKAPETVRFVRSLVQQLPMPLVIDADGLNALAGEDALLLRLPNKILTPHPGEMARLLGIPTADVLDDPIQCARLGAKRWNAIVVLKCAPTLIALPNGELFVNSTGNEGMATGGSGDVLTGTVAGLLGQVHTASAAALSGVYVHGLAGDLAKGEGTVGMKAGDLLDKLPSAIQKVLRHA